MKRVKEFMRILIFIFCCVIVSTGCRSKEEGRGDGVKSSRGNSKPYIVNVSTSSPQPLSDKDFKIDVTASDLDKDKIVLKYEWYLNNELLNGIVDNVLPKENFKKGDLIKVVITPSDEKEEGEPYIIDNLIVKNSPPKVKEVKIFPSVATLNDTIKVSAEGEDIDGDEVNFKYHWILNGEEIQENRDSPELVTKKFCKKGDSLWVGVVPNDGEEDGEVVISEVVTIQNSPPIITSLPPKIIKDNVFIYNVMATDADEDVLEYRLKESPEGMVIDKDTGLIKWTIGENEVKNATITIQVSDGNTVTEQSFQITIPK